MFIILRSKKNIFVHLRRSIKLIFLLALAIGLIGGAISFFYKPIYKVTLNGEVIGYTSNKTELQTKINEYMESNVQQNIAFTDIKVLPEYSLCLLKKDKQTNDDEIFGKVTNLGTTYYEYYAVLDDNEIKYYVGTKEEAEDAINQLKDKKSANKEELAYTQVYNIEKTEFTPVTDIVAGLYEKPKPRYVASTYVSGFTVEKKELGISLIRPTYGTITSRFGARWGSTHTGLDIAAPTGTNIAAAAAGTVTFSGNAGNGYGNYMIISHGGGISTLYGHCSALYVSEGEYVSQGQSIGAVGSTGNSTGSHLHLEIRVDGVAVNPEYYVY